MAAPEDHDGPATITEALRGLPVRGPGWDAAIEAGVDVSLLLRNLRLTPAQRIAQLQSLLRFQADVQERTVPAPVRAALEARRLREKLDALGPET